MSDNDLSEVGTFFAGLLIGGLVGAAAALLLAPQSGEETRIMIKDKGIELKDRANEASEKARTRVDTAVGDLRVKTDELAKATREWAASVQTKATPVSGGDIPLEVGTGAIPTPPANPPEPKKA
jgi:gas vesicle protein